LPRPSRWTRYGEGGKDNLTRVIESKTLALQIAEAALDKKAEEIVIIDVSGKVDYTDYLVVCSGGSERQVKIIADEVEDRLKRKRIIPFGIEGESEGNWVLMDYGSVILHVFFRDTRQKYDLDGLWLDADHVPVTSETEN
jgi:ribosome-associated protein